MENNSDFIDGVINGKINYSDHDNKRSCIDLLPQNIKDFYFDELVTEIMFNGQNVYIEKSGWISKLDISIDEHTIQMFIECISQYNNRNVDYNHPIFDGKLPDGSRCNIVIPPISLKGATITIRKHNKSMHTIDKLLEHKMLDERQKNILIEAIKAKENIIVSGGTGSGKTTLINALLNALTDLELNERIITIEDTAELSIQLPHVISLEARFPTPDCPVEVNIRDLVKASLRMRPDRIIIGEVRGSEAYDLLHALNTGHNGMICTMHSNSCRDSLRRLETLAILEQKNLDISIPRNWIAGNIDIVVHVEKNNGQRKILEIKRIEGIESSNYVMADV